MIHSVCITDISTGKGYMYMPAKKKTPLELANEIDQFMYDFDYYDYMDSIIEDREGAFNDLYNSIRNGDVGYIIHTLTEIVEGEDGTYDEQVHAKQLITELSRIGGAA